jgi:CubicO group peptidase (beta-lactamase class C family)
LQDAPGTRFSDSNTNYVLLGLVIEHATHNSLGAVLQQRIIRPLGLRHTRYELGTLHGKHLHGYETFSPAIGTPGPDGRIDMQPVNGTGYDASGALTSTVGDLSQYLRALLGGRLLRPTQLRAMQALTPAPFAPGPNPPPFSPSYWGLGLEGTTTRCGRIYGGTGGVLGYGAIMTGTPAGHRTVTLGVNELQSLPGLVTVLQREILPLICPPPRTTDGPAAIDQRARLDPSRVTDTTPRTTSFRPVAIVDAHRVETCLVVLAWRSVAGR